MHTLSVSPRPLLTSLPLHSPLSPLVLSPPHLHLTYNTEDIDHFLKGILHNQHVYVSSLPPPSCSLHTPINEYFVKHRLLSLLPSPLFLLAPINVSFSHSVEFSYHAPHYVHEVKIAGPWNHWHGEAMHILLQKKKTK